MITSGIMLVLCGVAAFFVLKSDKEEKEKQKQIALEELDRRVYGMKKESIGENEVVIPLYLSGGNKNVETFEYENEEAIYNVSRSKKTKAVLDELKKRNKYSIDAPLWAYNPYGTNELSLYLYCELQEAATLKYTIHLDNPDIPDFTRTAKVADNLVGSKMMECLITGMIPDQQNFIIIKLYNKKNEEIKRIVYSITPNPIKGSARPLLISLDGKSLEQISNGLYFFMGYDVDNDNVKKKIYLYDNSGLLRGAIPLVNGWTKNIMFLNGNMLYNYSDNAFAQVNEMGQVVKTHDLEGYKIANDFTYDGFGHLLMLATKNNEKSSEDRIVSLDLNTGKEISLINMGSLLEKVKKKAKLPKGAKTLDWIGLNSIVWTENDSVIVSSRELSGILKLENISSVKPSISYIIGDKALWKELGRTSKVMGKLLPEGTDTESIYFEEPFISQFGQCNLIYSPGDPGTEGQYYLTMYNNNYGEIPTRKDMDFSLFKGIGTKAEKAKTSYYYKYLVDEVNGTYDLVKSIEIPYSTYEGSLQEYNGHIIINSGTDCSVSEYDSNGKLIQALKYSVETFTRKVIKMDMKNFWYK